MPQQAQAATSIKVSAILVKTNDWTTICNGGLFLANIDLSQPRDRMYNCGIKTLVNKKIEGILQLQVLNNQIWEDFEQSSHWFPTSKGYFNSQNRHTFSYPIKLKSHNYGEISKGTKITYLNKKSAAQNSGADWLSGPLPYVDDSVVGGDSYITSIREVKLRVKVTSGSSDYFSNPVTYIYSNHTYFTIALDKYGYKTLVPRNPNSVAGTNSAPRPAAQNSPLTFPTAQPQTSKLPLCTGTQEANLINLLSQYVTNNRMIGIYRQNLEKTINDLGNAYARNSMYDIEKLSIDKKSWEAKLDELYKKSDNLKKQEESILVTCIRKSDNSNSPMPNTQKKPCTQNEINRLLVMISQYTTKQELIRTNKTNIEKLRIELNYAVSSGRNTANYQVAIEKFSRLLEVDLASASLIMKEFNALNDGCLNSNLSLP